MLLGCAGSFLLGALFAWRTLPFVLARLDGPEIQAFAGRVAATRSRRATRRRIRAVE